MLSLENSKLPKSQLSLLCFCEMFNTWLQLIVFIQNLKQSPNLYLRSSGTDNISNFNSFKVFCNPLSIAFMNNSGNSKNDMLNK